jgi:fucose 4-O-acetylase-like acetyltransferase
MKFKLDFYKRRFISITPGFYTQLLFVVILNLASVRIFGHPFVGVGRTDAFSVLINAFLLHGVIPTANNSVFPGGWFIGSLWILYLLHPWIYDLYVRAKKPIVIVIVGSCCGVLLTLFVNALREGNLNVVNNSFEYFLFSNQLCCYLCGMWLFFNIDRLMRIQKGFITIAAVIALGTTVFVFYSNVFGRYIIVTPLMGVTSMLGYLFFKKNEFQSKASKLILALGRNSFYIYLVHTIAVWPIARALNKMIGMGGIDNQIVALMLLIIPTIAITAALAYGLNILVNYEKRIMKL